MRDDLNSNLNNSNTASVVTASKTASVQLQSSSAKTTSVSLTPGLVLSGLLIFIVSLSVLFWIFLIFRNWFFNRQKLNHWKKMVFMEISVPKETAEQVQKDRSGGNNPDKEMIAAGQQIYAVLADYAQDNLKNWLNLGPTFSLEILCVDKEIRFWVVCEKTQSEIIERQIVAVYQKAHIVRITKAQTVNNFFKPDTVSYAQELILGNRFELPFKTFQLTEGDPINVITNSMSGLASEESLAVQMVLTPIKNHWQKNSRESATRINQGQNPEDYLSYKSNFWKGLGKFLNWIIKGLGETFNSFFEKKDDKNDFDKEKKDRRYMDVSGKYEQIQLTEQQREIVKKLEEKASRPGFNFSLRIVSSSKTLERSKSMVDSLVPSFQVYGIRPFNWFEKSKTNQKQAILDFMMRAQTIRPFQFRAIPKYIINTEEATSIWHLPNHLVNTPNIKWLLARKPAIPLEVPNLGKDTIYLGTAVARGQTKEIYVKTEDRFRHIYSLGGSGSGKTITMNNVILQDIQMGNGVCFVDPHGEGVDDILRRMPAERLKDVILFSPSITDKPLGLNMLEFNPLKPTEKTLVIDILFNIWDKLYDLKKTGGPMFENYMKNSMRLVMGHPESGSTLMEISKVLVDEDFRSFKLAMCDEPEVIDFWEKEATKAGGEASLENMVPYITSKLAPFITNDFIKPMIGQQKSAVNFRQAMDNKKIVLVSLAKGLIGETSAYLVGMVIVGNLLMSGMGRSDGLQYNEDGTTTPITPLERSPFFVYIDEMQNFLFDAIPKALEEIRKYKVGFYLAHQFIKQVVVDGSERIKDSLMANCATKIIYRCSAEDAKFLESEFSPLTVQDIANPEARTFNTIILVDGQRTAPFNVTANYSGYRDRTRRTLLFKNKEREKPFPLDDKSTYEECAKYAAEIGQILPPYDYDDYFAIEKDKNLMKRAQDQKLLLIEMTKEKYGKPREQVEQEIKDRAKLLF
jgi:hypothetical protein